MASVAQRIIAARQGGDVLRHHTYHTLKPETVSQHTFNMINLLVMLHPEPSTNLIKACLWHDVAEAYTGDIPSPAKKAFPELKQASLHAEDIINEKLGFTVTLSESESDWLHGIDKLDYLMWLTEQPGTEAVQQKFSGIIKRIMEDEKVPAEIRTFAEGYIRFWSGKRMDATDIIAMK